MAVRRLGKSGDKTIAKRGGYHQGGRFLVGAGYVGIGHDITQSIERAAKTLEALGRPSRLWLLRELGRAALAVADLDPADLAVLEQLGLTQGNGEVVVLTRRGRAAWAGIKGMIE